MIHHHCKQKVKKVKKLIIKAKRPNFKHIKIPALAKDLDALLTRQRRQLKKLLSQKTFSWSNLMIPLQNMDEVLETFWRPISILHNSKNSNTLRKAYNKCLPKLVQYGSELSHNKDLYLAICSLKKGASYKKYNQEQKRVITQSIKGFKYSGVHLSANKKQQLKTLEQKLSELSTKFSENVLDATQSFKYHVKNKKQLSGLPEHVKALAKQKAGKKKGWILGLDFPTYYAVMTHADDVNLRKIFYKAYSTLASKISPFAKQFDNTKIILSILSLRNEMAKLLNKKSFAHLALHNKMARTPQQVLNFLNKIAKKAVKPAKKEFAELQHFVKKCHRKTKLQPWDIAYYSEKLQKHLYDISQEMLRPYFPEQHVIKGMFDLVEKLFHVKIRHVTNKNTWHKDVKYYELFDAHNKRIAGFYADLYTRKQKNGGAWMDDTVSRKCLNKNTIQMPLASLNCNFAPPAKGKPCLLSHDEVQTLFHEFGHCLQHILTKINEPEISGINGVEWDAVEFCSQFLELFVWDKKIIDLISSHYKTKQKLPNDLYQKLILSKNFQSALGILRQITLGLFDYRIHLEFKPNKTFSVQKILNSIRKKWSVIPISSHNRFQNSFRHIFSGAYAAGYYSYMWADVLSCDAFYLFKQHGVISAAMGKRFLHHILEKGSIEPTMVLYKKFRKRAPKIDALLKENGLI